MMIGRHRWTIINPVATTLIPLKLRRSSLIRITGQAKYFPIVALTNALLNAFQDQSGEFSRFFYKSIFSSTIHLLVSISISVSIPANFYIEKMAIHQYLEIKIVFAFVSDSRYATWHCDCSSGIAWWAGWPIKMSSGQAVAGDKTKWSVFKINYIIDLEKRG